METKNDNRYREKLARLILIAGIAAIAFFTCRYFINVLSYIALAAIISLIARPVMHLLRKVRIKKKSAPEWFLALLSILFLFVILSGIIAGFVPVISQVVSKVSTLISSNGISGISVYLANFNEFLRDTFSLDGEFKIENVVVEQLKPVLSINLFGNLLGSVASTVISICIGIFSVVFISFFLIKDDKLIPRIIIALSPDALEERISEAIHDVEYLLSRYFVGLIIEMTCVGIIDFVGLWAIARLDFESALGIGFLAGLLNIIPYVGPFIGGFFGTLMGVILKFSAVSGIDVNFWFFVVILILVFCTAQFVDNYVLQPLIYSSSIQAAPLEIFIVMLLAGTIGGVVGMLVAIPCYTVIRVIAVRFFPDVKFIRMLVRNK